MTISKNQIASALVKKEVEFYEHQGTNDGDVAGYFAGMLYAALGRADAAGDETVSEAVIEFIIGDEDGA